MIRRLALVLAREAAWIGGPPLIAGLILGLLWSTLADQFTPFFCEPEATASLCSGQGCTQMSHGEWELSILAMDRADSWLWVGLVAYLSVGVAIVRWLTVSANWFVGRWRNKQAPL